MGSDQNIDLDDISYEMAKIPDFISALRSGFQPKDFKKVEEILVFRENRYKEEIQHWKNEYGLIAEKQGETSLSLFQREKELGNCKRQLDEVTKTLTQLQEDNKLSLEKISVFDERDKRVWVKYEKVLEDNEKLCRDNNELLLKNEELGCLKAKAEIELESEKKKNDELELRVHHLEEAIKEWESETKRYVAYELRVYSLEKEIEKLKQLGVEEKKSSTDAGKAKSGNSNGVEVNEVILNRNENEISSRGGDSVDKNVNPLKRAGEDFGVRPCIKGQGQTMLERGESSYKVNRQKTNTSDIKTEMGILIDITDSDDETQMQTPNIPNHDGPEVEQPGNGNDCTLGSQRQRRIFSDTERRENEYNDFTFSSSSSDESCDSDTINKIYSERKARGVYSNPMYKSKLRSCTRRSALFWHRSCSTGINLC